MLETTRRNFLGAAALATPARWLVDMPPGDRTGSAGNPRKIVRVEALLLQQPLTERFWMSISPIGGMKPVAHRLIVRLHTDTGITGYGEGSGGGADVFRQGIADLVVGEDPFMVGKIWEKIFGLTYDR